MAKKKDKPRPPKSQLDAAPVRPKAIAWSGPGQLLEHAREFPLLGCWRDQNWEENGLARVVVARQPERGQVLFGSYLVDYYCLGVKDCLWKAGLSQNAFERRLPDLLGTAEPCEPGFAHQLIYGAIAYAGRWGFEPHPDFKAASQILEPPGTYPATYDIQYGQNGKPLYIAGPHDNPRRILAKLAETAGEGNYDYLAVFGGDEE